MYVYIYYVIHMYVYMYIIYYTYIIYIYIYIIHIILHSLYKVAQWIMGKTLVKTI